MIIKKNPGVCLTPPAKNNSKKSAHSHHNCSSFFGLNRAHIWSAESWLFAAERPLRLVDLNQWAKFVQLLIGSYPEAKIRAFHVLKTGVWLKKKPLSIRKCRQLLAVSVTCHITQHNNSRHGRCSPVVELSLVRIRLSAWRLFLKRFGWIKEKS